MDNFNLVLVDDLGLSQYPIIFDKQPLKLLHVMSNQKGCEVKNLVTFTQGLSKSVMHSVHII